MKKNKNVVKKINKFRLFGLFSFFGLLNCSLFQILQAKIRRLEHLLQLKDVRVDGLADQLGQTKGVLKGNGLADQPGQTKGVLKSNGGKPNRQQQTQVPLKGRK